VPAERATYNTDAMAAAGAANAGSLQPTLRERAMIRRNDEPMIRDRKLNLDELESVSGGRKAGGNQDTSGKNFLTFRFDIVFTTKI
jgi:hypothetical protein